MTSDEVILMTQLVDLVSQLAKDVKELQDKAGISFERWKTSHSEQYQLYIRNRMLYHRLHGEGLMGSKKLADQELLELHQQGLLS